MKMVERQYCCGCDGLPPRDVPNVCCECGDVRLCDACWNARIHTPLCRRCAALVKEQA
jgi:hypothetical protein